MHTTKAKKDKTRITLKLDLASIPKGHVAHRGGGGRHADRRTARNRTRSQQRANALRGD